MLKVQNDEFILKLQPIFSNGNIRNKYYEIYVFMKMTKEMKFENTIDHDNNDLNLDPKEDVQTFNIMT